MPFASPEFHASGCVQGTDCISHDQLSIISCFRILENEKLLGGKVETRSLALTQQKEGNANRAHCYTEPFEEMMGGHVGHSKYGLFLHQTYLEGRHEEYSP